MNEFGALDILVANAGQGALMPVRDMKVSRDMIELIDSIDSIDSID